MPTDERVRAELLRLFAERVNALPPPFVFYASNPAPPKPRVYTYESGPEGWCNLCDDPECDGHPGLNRR